MDLGLTQKQAAANLGVDADTVRNWEAGRTSIGVRFYPALIVFLGFRPLTSPQSRGQAVQNERIARGLSRKRLALIAGVDEATVARLEEDRPRLAQASAAAILAVLGIETGGRLTGTDR